VTPQNRVPSSASTTVTNRAGLRVQRLTPEELVTRLAAIVDSSEDAIVGRDERGIINTWNAAATRMFGYEPDEILGQSVLLLVPPDLHHEELANLERLHRGERIEHWRTQRLRKDGEKFEISVSISPIRDTNGRVVGSALIARDIGVQQREQAANARLAAIVESSDDAIVAKDLNGIITDWNAAAERMFGYKAAEIIGHSVLTIIPAELQHEEPVILRKIRAGERIEHHETRRMRKNGEIFDVSLTISPIKDTMGRVIGASKIARDISDRKAAEAAIIEKEKLAAAGRLAATLAHEVNNPLESITNLGFLLLHHQPLDSEARRYAELLFKEVQRAGEITRQTLSYHKATREKTEVNITEILEHIARWKKKKLDAKTIELKLEFDNPPLVYGYAGELRQVFDNLIENAIDALSPGGTILVRARARRVGETQQLVVHVCDNGEGIPRRLRIKIFDPFFTTKPKTGSGLGLWVTREIVQKHGGTIRVRSTHSPQRHGSIFTIILPTTSDHNLKPHGTPTSLRVA
jgi:PAS domain S-box-containing protein